jgi:hypothetical protein
MLSGEEGMREIALSKFLETRDGGRESEGWRGREGVGGRITTRE